TSTPPGATTAHRTPAARRTGSSCRHPSGRSTSLYGRASDRVDDDMRTSMKRVLPMFRLRKATARLLLVSVVVGSIVGCADFLDVNDNPNTATDVRMDLILPGVLVNFTQNILGFPTERYGSTTGLTSWATEWTQQWSWNRDERPYSQFHHYEVSEGDADQPWNAAYTNVMKNSLIIMQKASESGDWPYHGIAKFIFAWTLSIVSDAWGPVPYKQAFDTRVYGPAYDSQQEVYAGVHQLIEEAIEEMRREGRTPTSNDLLYG